MKTKAQISGAPLICTFVFADENCLFSHDAAHLHFACDVVTGAVTLTTRKGNRFLRGRGLRGTWQRQRSPQTCWTQMVMNWFCHQVTEKSYELHHEKSVFGFLSRSDSNWSVQSVYRKLRH